MKIIIRNQEMLLINSKGRETKITLDSALALWKAGIAQPDTETARCLIRGWY